MTSPLFDDICNLHAGLERHELPPSFWQTMGTHKKDPTETFIKQLLSTHNIDSPCAPFVSALVSYAAVLHTLKATESTQAAPEPVQESPTKFELNHVYKMKSPKAIQDSESLISSSSEADLSDGDNEEMEDGLFLVTGIYDDCQHKKAKVP